VTVHRENVYSCNLMGFKGKANTRVGVKGKVRFFFLYQIY